jgi:hypothetical protein
LITPRINLLHGMVDTPEDYWERKGYTPKPQNPFYNELPKMPPGMEPKSLPSPNPFLDPYREYLPDSDSGEVPGARMNLLRGMGEAPLGQPLGQPFMRDPEDVLSAVPFLPPEIPQEFYEELMSLAAGRWGKAENFVPGMALPTEPEIDEDELDLDPGEGLTGFV